MTILVLASLGATLAAIGGLGSTPMRKSNGIRPYMGVKWGHAARTPGAGAPDRTPIIRPAPAAPTTSAVINMVRTLTAPPLQPGAEFDAVGPRRRILREASKEVTRCSCVHERIRQVSAPQTDGVRPIVHMPVEAGIDVVIGRLTQLIVRLGAPSAVVKVLRIERPVSCRCRNQIAQT